VARCRQHGQTKSQTRGGPETTNGEQFNRHWVPRIDRRCGRLPDGWPPWNHFMIVSMRMPTLQDSQPPLHRNIVVARTARSRFGNRRPARLARPMIMRERMMSRPLTRREHDCI
jgi:hypothetical protein